MQLFMPQRFFQPNQTTVWQSILSHKNVSVKTLPWVALPNWLNSQEVQAFGCCLWVVADSVMAHALHQQLCHTTSVEQATTIALLGGDFPPAQERRWKQQYREGTLTTLIVTPNIVKRYLKIEQRSVTSTVFKTVIWVDCLPSNAILQHWQSLPPADVQTISSPMFLLLNPPDAAVLPFASPVEWTEPALPVTTTAQLRVFKYPWQATEGVVKTVQGTTYKDMTIIVCPTTTILRAMQAILAVKPCTVLSLPAGMPWVLFNTLLQTYFEAMTDTNTDTNKATDDIQPPCILLLEASLLPAWRLWYQQTVMASHRNVPVLRLIWFSLPASPIQIGLVCEGLSAAALTVSVQYVKGQPRLMGLPTIWRWIVATNTMNVCISPLAQPVVPPWQQWGIRLLLNCLLYL